jgi:hypothetical protein
MNLRCALRAARIIRATDKDTQQVGRWWNKASDKQIDYVRINRRLWMDGESVMAEKVIDR